MKDQVISCFDLLVRLNNLEMEYDHWVESEQDLPVELCQLKGMNMEDEKQVHELLVLLFLRNKAMVDFYLSQIVFPRAAQSFPSKLPSSRDPCKDANWNVDENLQASHVLLDLGASDHACVEHRTTPQSQSHHLPLLRNEIISLFFAGRYSRYPLYGGTNHQRACSFLNHPRCTPCRSHPWFPGVASKLLWVLRRQVKHRSWARSAPHSHSRAFQ